MGVMMTKPMNGAVRPRAASGVAGPLLTMLCVTLLSACSSVPDAVNPAEWYRSATADGTASADGTANNELQADRGKGAPGSDSAFPSVSRVDQQIAARDKRTEGLAADVEGRRYADGIARQGQDAQNSLYGDKPPAAPQMEQPTVAAPAPQPAAPTPQPTPTPQPATPAPSATAQATPQPAPAPAQTASTATDPSAGVDGMRDRLAQQLAEIRARAADRGSLLPEDLTYGSDTEPTVIVSSAGIETERAMSLSGQDGSLSQQPSLSAFANPGQVENLGALPIPADAKWVATILFGNGSAALDARDRQILADVVRLQKQNGSKVRIIGHASQRTRNIDPAQHKLANLKMSVGRANQVADELRKMGVAADNILVAAVGDNNPVYLEIMPSGEAGNRRAEIYLSN